MIFHGSNLSQLFSALISLCFLYFLKFSGVGDLFFCLYSSSRILMSFFNSHVIHGFRFVYLIFYFLMENLNESNVKLYS